MVVRFELAYAGKVCLPGVAAATTESDGDGGLLEFGNGQLACAGRYSGEHGFAARGNGMLAVAIGTTTAQMLQVVLGKFQAVAGGVRSRAWPADSGKLVFNRPQLFNRAEAAAEYRWYVAKISS